MLFKHSVVTAQTLIMPRNKYIHPNCKENEVFLFLDVIHALTDSMPVQIERKLLHGRKGEEPGSVLIHSRQDIARTGVVLTGRYAGRIVEMTDTDERPCRVTRLLENDGGHVDPHLAERSLRKSRIPEGARNRFVGMLEGKHGFPSIIAELLELTGIHVETAIFTSGKKARGRRSPIR